MKGSRFLLPQKYKYANQGGRKKQMGGGQEPEINKVHRREDLKERRILPLLLKKKINIFHNTLTT